MTIKPANTQPTAVGTMVSTGLAGFPPAFGEQTSAERQRHKIGQLGFSLLCSQTVCESYISHLMSYEFSEQCWMPLFRRLYGQRQELKQNFELLLLFIFWWEVGGKVQFLKTYKKWGGTTLYEIIIVVIIIAIIILFLGGGGGKFWYTTFLWTPSLSIQNLPRWKYPTLQDELQVKKNCSCTITNTTLILACIYSQHCSPYIFKELTRIICLLIKPFF